MEALYTAIATTVGGRSGHVKSSDGVINMEIRPPKEMGGPDASYVNPELLFAAGYSACFGSAISHVALERNLRVRPEVTAKVSIGNKDGGGYQLAVEMDVKFPESVSLQDAQTLVEEAHQICPYSNATRNNIEVKLNVVR
ncbi:organic hydroperoxide resistance protein [Dysgonomonas sp. Marseille-P4677]|uniref:organic hydroperoxide resistance protein n=1 Tax=Dysgonomonas sp. Marseille-P4677 TaxID=2364790 RepID=UPI001F487D99|nr:organic hydroperoxide resistance protein [Dysgonomonas sp. Marseille-P4677]